MKKECLNCKQQPEKYYTISGSTEIYCKNCLNQVLEQNKQRIFMEVVNGALMGKSICPWCEIWFETGTVDDAILDHYYHKHGVDKGKCDKFYHKSKEYLEGWDGAELEKKRWYCEELSYHDSNKPANNSPKPKSDDNNIHIVERERERERADPKRKSKTN